METDKEKYERWLAGKEKAKKMWFNKYREMRAQRDEALYRLRQAESIPYPVRMIIAISLGANVGSLLWLILR